MLSPGRHLCVANMQLPEAKSSGGWRAVSWGFEETRSGFKPNLGSHFFSNVQHICFLPYGFSLRFQDMTVLYKLAERGLKGHRVQRQHAAA